MGSLAPIHRPPPWLVRTLTLALLASAVTAAAPAAACSVVSTYRVPTNFELVDQADTIMLANVEGGSPAGTRMGDAQLVMRPTHLLKGDALPAELRLRGMSLAPPHLRQLSDPDELEQAHPLAYAGACTRRMFTEGSTVLLFLGRHGDELVPMSAPFARTAEDVPSTESRWVRAVRLYADIAALPEARRAAAMRTRQAELRALGGDDDAQAIADDIDRQLRGPNRPWNTIMEEEIRRSPEPSFRP